jgi:hypothetical protein
MVCKMDEKEIQLGPSRYTYRDYLSLCSMLDQTAYFEEFQEKVTILFLFCVILFFLIRLFVGKDE